MVRTTFCVQGICCSSEVPIVQRVVQQYARQQRNTRIPSVHVNILRKYVYVTHNPQHVSAEDIRQTLHQAGFPTQIITTSASIAGGNAATSSILHRQQRSSSKLTETTPDSPVSGDRVDPNRLNYDATRNDDEYDVNDTT